MATSDTDQLVQEIDVIRDRLAGTIDQLVERTAPKNIARRAVASVKSRFVDESGSVRLETVVPIVVGVVVLVGGSIVVRRVLR